MHLIEHFDEQRSDNRRNDDAYQARPHKTVVQQVLSDDGRTRTVEVYGRNVGRIIRDEEITTVIVRRKY